MPVKKKTFEELYEEILEHMNDEDIEEKLNFLKGSSKNEEYHLDCILHPEKYAPVLKWEKCDCSFNKHSKCIKSCDFDALKISDDGNIYIEKDKCIGCGRCIEVCEKNRFKPSKDIIPVLNTIRLNNRPVYALIAPAFIGQFGSDITPGKLRCAFKKMGFEGMVEVALFADILTLKEALEFDKNIKKESDFQLTSCCCPVWIKMIKKIYSTLIPHVPPSVSPMIACGRVVKKLVPQAVTVFIGPCLAKKAEAREPDIKDAIDYVLTFQEVNQIFGLMNINLKNLSDIDKEHSSEAGRIYARSGGVSEAVNRTLSKIRKQDGIKLKYRVAQGPIECKELLQELIDGKVNENFFEGMGCVGGCVGGPRTITDKELGRKNVNIYGSESEYATPIDNLYVIKLLNKLGFDTIDKLLEDRNFFSRKI